MWVSIFHKIHVGNWPLLDIQRKKAEPRRPGATQDTHHLPNQLRTHTDPVVNLKARMLPPL